MKTRVFFIFLILPLFFASFSLGKEMVYLDITSPDARKIHIAVPWFVNSDQTDKLQIFGRDIAAILGRALEFHGTISVIPNTLYGKEQNADWKALGADYVVKGTYSLSGSGFKLELRLFDVAAGDTFVGKMYRGLYNQRIDMLFTYTDTVIEELTGKKGVASSKIAFISDQSGHKEVYISDILGIDIRQITRHKNLVVSPRFLPGNQYLTYSSYHSGNQNLYITDLKQSQTTRPLSRRKGLNMAPAWSPDGEKMICTLSKDGNPDLFLMDRKGLIIKQLTKRSGINVSPAWAPNGKEIAFVSDRSGRPQLYIMNIESGETQRITFHGSENAEPDWSPDGDLIAYSGLVDGSYQIFTTIPRPSSNPEQVTNGPGSHESPTWSPDGRQIVFSLRKDNKQKICAIMKNGDYLRQLFTLPGNESSPRWSKNR